MVRSPDGRTWRIRRSWYRWGGAEPIPEGGWEAEVRESGGGMPYGRWVFAVSDALWQLAGPLLEAGVGRRPWIEASADRPTVTMVWRATGREATRDVLDEIAGALERGEDRPTPLGARWCGYDRGGIRLASKH